MSKFTKGKWIYDDESNYIFNDNKQMTIAQIRGWGYLTQKLCLSDDEAYEVQQANARLAAAAPEMYKMLKTLLQKIGKNFAVIDFGSPLVPTSKELHSDMKVWEAKSFFDFREIKELLARIDGEEHEELHEVEAQA